ncbi:hypothetical protein CAPTEDRAFT_111093 [Capitella teleta]|uniref:Pyridoxal phosphate phosphatase PHOSPHO2 n=1 Tax=Capitella teleta TaxID=283909 RepID=R7VHD7_CAPTE|nr:hypothetical protein CAPTEDRAFT_111093 [Capitella teleta]|eukprot:ELU18039.1 hypothetical protein CAPTEDRAFT_111093 [Capitella teleta]
MSNKRLIAFDFDHTLIDDNSDLYVRKLAPNGKIPQRIHDLFDDSGWTEYMAAIFEYLHDNGTTPAQILACMTEIGFTSGMTELLAYLAGDSYDVIIISDANSVFIEHIMKHAGLHDAVSAIFTNPAHFNASGRLELAYYHTQDWCELSTRNLCKGHVLLEYIKQQKDKGVDYSSVAYIGDGSNDLCPSLKLTSNDLVFPRVGYSLAKKVDSYKDKLLAKVVPWSSGLDILKELQKTHV